MYFFQAATEAFNPGGHGAGWLLNASLDSGPITFDLTVSNITADSQVTERLRIGYDSHMRIVLSVAEP